MKKIILILFLFLSCYIIYNKTEDNIKNILLLGDNNANLQELNKLIPNTKLNNNYIDQNYRIIDLINIIEYNQEKEINNQKISIHRLMKNTDILILSIGMNDIYPKLNDNTKNIYTDINNIINDIEILLSKIDKYHYQQVFVLGYYNITNKNTDLFTYLNYKTEKITKKYNYNYINLNKIINNNPKYLKKTDNFELNNQGYNEINKIIVEKIKKY